MAVTANKIIIIAENKINNAIISLLGDASEVATLPLSNVQFQDNEEIARINSTSACILIAWGKKVALNSISLYRHNLSNTATIRVRHFLSADGSGTPHYDSTVFDAIPKKTLAELEWGIDSYIASAFDDWHIRFSSLHHDNFVSRSTIVDIVDDNNSDGYIDIARIYAGKRLTPAFNFSYGHGLTWFNNDQQTRLAGGGMHTTKSTALRRLHFNMSWLTEADANEFSKMRREAGNADDIFISMFPGVGGTTERDRTMACVLVNNSEITNNFHNNSTHDIVAEEV